MQIPDNIRAHLPTVKFPDSAHPSIPPVSKKVADLIHTIQPMVADDYQKFRPLDHCVEDLQKEMVNLQEAKNSAPKYKILSLLSLSVWVVIAAAGVAGAILFPLPTFAIIGGVLALAFLGGIAGAFSHPSFSENASRISGFLAGFFTLGLSIPIEVLSVAFGRESLIKEKIGISAPEAKRCNEEMALYMSRYYDKLKRELEVREAKNEEEKNLFQEASDELERLKPFCALQDKKPQTSQIASSHSLFIAPPPLSFVSPMEHWQKYRHLLANGCPQVSVEEMQILARIASEAMQRGYSAEKMRDGMEAHLQKTDRKPFLEAFLTSVLPASPCNFLIPPPLPPQLVINDEVVDIERQSYVSYLKLHADRAQSDNENAHICLERQQEIARVNAAVHEARIHAEASLITAQYGPYYAYPIF